MFTSVPGNHGRGDSGNSDAPVSRQNATVTTTTPQQGTAAFNIPNNLTVKKTLPIGDVIADPVASPATETQKQPTAPAAATKPEPQIEPDKKEEAKTVAESQNIDNQNIKEEKKKEEVVETEPQKELTPEELEMAAKKELEELADESDTDNLYATEEYLDEEDKKEAEKQLEMEQELNMTAANATTQQPEEPQDPLTIQWNAMLENVFSKIRTILYPLKNHPPTIKDKILYVKVKGAIQEEHFNSKKREVLAYWRNNVDEQIEDLIVETDETLEAPKMIYDNNDKLNHFKEENAEFGEFLNILNLKIKD